MYFFMAQSPFRRRPWCCRNAARRAGRTVLAAARRDRDPILRGRAPRRACWHRGRRLERDDGRAALRVGRGPHRDARQLQPGRSPACVLSVRARFSICRAPNLGLERQRLAERNHRRLRRAGRSLRRSSRTRPRPDRRCRCSPSFACALLLMKRHTDSLAPRTATCARCRCRSRAGCRQVDVEQAEGLRAVEQRQMPRSRASLHSSFAGNRSPTVLVEVREGDHLGACGVIACG